jgi:hypothetical protein
VVLAKQVTESARLGNELATVEEPLDKYAKMRTMRALRYKKDEELLTYGRGYEDAVEA